MKIIGADWLAFIAAKWPGEDDYIDYVDLTVNGIVVPEGSDAEINASDMVEIRDGLVYSDGEYLAIKPFFRRWKKAQSTARLALEVDQKDLDLLKELLKTLKVRVKIITNS